MQHKENIKELFNYLQTKEDKVLEYDEDAIVEAFQINNTDQSLAIKILSIGGGILACLAFLGFLAIAGLFDAEIGLILIGIFSIAGSILINKLYDKIILDTVSVSSFIIGFILLGFGLDKSGTNENTISIIFIVLGLLSLAIVQNYILSFIAVLIINGSIMMLIHSAYSNISFQIYASILALLVTYIFLKEAKLITANKMLSKLYNPIRIGLALSFIAGLEMLRYIINHDFIWITSIFIIGAIMYLLSPIIQLLNVTKTQDKVIIYIICALLLLPTAFSPAISGAVLIILLSFWVNYKTCLVIGIVAFIYAISRYYYDLNLTLLTKSAMLFSSGILFIVLYFFTHKKLTTHEKI